jgi:hypothetical protein
MLLFGLGRDAWKSHKKWAETSQIPGLSLVGVGNKSKAFDREIKDYLHEYFKNFKLSTEPRATRQVREDVGGTWLKDDDSDVFDLPPYLSKRSLCMGWCRDRGWEVRGSHKSNPREYANDIEEKARQDEIVKTPIFVI